MKVYDFTVPELNYFRTYCNFTNDERQLFELRSQNMPLEQCAEKNECQCVHGEKIKPKSQ